LQDFFVILHIVIPNKSVMTKNKKEETSAVVTLLSVFPPLALLFIIVGWFKGSKVSTLSVIGVIAAIIFSVIFAVQLYKPL